MLVIISYAVQKFLFITIGIVGLGLLIALHELGHFLFCKLFNVYTPSFSIGFGPIIFSKIIGETTFKLSAIPLGGYVEIAQSTENNLPNTSNSIYFETIYWWQKLLIMLGGICFNLLSAYTIIILLSLCKDPLIIYKNYAQSSIASIKDDSKAFQEGLTNQCRIIAINHHYIDQEKSLLEELKKYTSKQEIQVVQFETNNTKETRIFEIKMPYDITSLNTEEKASLFLETLLHDGITFDTAKTISIYSLIKNGIYKTNSFIKQTFKGLLSVATGKKNANLSGPIMIIALSSTILAKGIFAFLFFLAIISINLALINLVPLPILDGGQILFLLIEIIFRRPLNERIREFISIACWVLFLILFVYLSWTDISTLIIKAI